MGLVGLGWTGRTEVTCPCSFEQEKTGRNGRGERGCVKGKKGRIWARKNVGRSVGCRQLLVKRFEEGDVWWAEDDKHAFGRQMGEQWEVRNAA